MKLVKFSYTRVVEMQSFQEIKLSEKNAEKLKKLLDDSENDAKDFLVSLGKIDYGKESEDDVLEDRMENLEITDLNKKLQNL